MTDKLRDAAQQAEREAFERALAAKPDARFWNTADAMFWAWQARAALAQQDTRRLPTLPFAVFDEFGQECEDRVRDHFSAAMEQQDAQAVPQGWKLVPSIGTRVKANHPITCLNPDEWFEVSDVRSEPDGGFVVRGKSTCWFGISMLAAPTPLAQRVELTEGDIREWWVSENGLEDCDMTKLDDFTKVVRAIIEAYERKNGIAQPCWCQACRPITINDMRMVLCPKCGNKRCPHANDHRNPCTGSNEPGQPGSAYPST